MRAVALSDKEVQGFVEEHFIPLKVSMEPGTKELPLDWPAALGWRWAYLAMGGEDCNGFTGCFVASPDLKAHYGGTGSASIAELFDSVAYNQPKFLGMLKKSEARFQAEQSVLRDRSLNRREKKRKIAELRSKAFVENLEDKKKTTVRKGFNWLHAVELFKQSGDL